MGLKSSEPNADHNSFMTDLKTAISNHQHLSGQEMLALTSQLVGSLIALQDVRRFSPELVMNMVISNIEIGNSMTIMTMPAAGNA